MPPTTPNGQIQTRQQNAPAPASKDKEHPLISLIMSNGMKAEIARALPKHVTADRMARVALTALRTTKDLDLCTPASFLACIMQASQLGLEVNTPLGHAWLIPRKNRNLRPNERECTLMIGYQGLIELARRSGEVLSIWAYPVYEGDDFRVTYGLKPDIHHEPTFDGKRDKATLRYVYAAAKLRDNDQPIFVCLTKTEIEGYRKRGASGSNISTPWDTDYEAMALKTAVRRLYRWMPKSIEMARAVDVDEPENDRHQVFDSAIADSVQRGAGLELPSESESPEVLSSEQVPETAQHADHVEMKSEKAPRASRAQAAPTTKPADETPTDPGYDRDSQDAPPPDDR